MSKNINLLSVLQKNDGTRKMVDDCISDVADSEGIVIFGAGVGGGMLYDLLESRDLTCKILCWSDNNALKFGQTYKTDKLDITPPSF